MKSGLFYPNRFVRITLQSLEEVIGPSGMTAIYGHTHLSQLAESLPPDDMEKQVDFSDFSMIFDTLQTIFGERGARTLAIRAGRLTFRDGMKFFGKIAEPGSEPGTGPLGAHSVYIHLNRLSNFFNGISDQRSSVESTESINSHFFKIEICPMCIDRSDPDPVCAFFEGLLSESAKTFSGGLEYTTREIECMASGAEACKFEITLVKN